MKTLENSFFRLDVTYNILYDIELLVGGNIRRQKQYIGRFRRIFSPKWRKLHFRFRFSSECRSCGCRTTEVAYIVPRVRYVYYGVTKDRPTISSARNSRFKMMKFALFSTKFHWHRFPVCDFATVFQLWCLPPISSACDFQFHDKMPYFLPISIATVFRSAIFPPFSSQWFSLRFPVPPISSVCVFYRFQCHRFPVPLISCLQIPVPPFSASPSQVLTQLSVISNSTVMYAVSSMLHSLTSPFQ